MRAGGRFVAPPPPPPPPPHAPLDTPLWNRSPPATGAYEDPQGENAGLVYVSPKRGRPQESTYHRGGHASSVGDEEPGSPKTLGEGERAALTNVVQRLRRGLDFFGPDGRKPSEPPVPYDSQGGEGPDGMPSTQGLPASELRQQLDSAGRVIAHQMMTSARKDILLSEQEERCRLERLQLQMQLEHLHDRLAQAEVDRAAMEDALAARGEEVRQGEEEQERLREEVGAAEMRLEEAAEENRQMVAKLDELREEKREALQHAADNQEQALAAAEEQRREEKREAEDQAEVLLCLSQEADGRNEIILEALEELADIFAEFQTDSAAILEQQEQQMAEAREECAQEMEQLRESQAEEMEQLRTDQAEEAEALRQEHGQETADLQEQTEQERQQLTDAHAQELEEAISARDQLQEANTALEEQIAQMEEEHRLALQEAQDAMERKVEERATEISSEYRTRIDSIVEENERARGEIEGPLRAELSDLLRLCSRGDLHLVHELVHLQQEAGRLTVLLEQQQEMFQFFLTRYAPHHLDFDGIEDPELPPGTKHVSPYPSYWGWMHRSSGMFVTWQRRFFFLRDGVLRFGTSDEGPFNTLLHCEAIARVEMDSYADAAQVSHPPTGRYEAFGFLVETYSRQKFRFCCSCSSERSEWMSVLRKHIEIRLDRERRRAYDPSRSDAQEPFLYLEDCSPPGPPPTYRTRIRLADCGAYPLMGPGSPRRAELPPPLSHYEGSPVPPSPRRRGPSSPRYGDPARPVMVTPPRARGQNSQPRSSGGRGPSRVSAAAVGPIRVGPGQQGGASGVTIPRERDRLPAAAAPPVARRTSRTSTGARPSGAKPAPPPVNPGPAGYGLTATSDSVGDPFEGTVPVDVLLVKCDPGQEEEEAEIAAVTRSLHALCRQFQSTYDTSQVLHCGSNSGAAAVQVAEILGSSAPTSLRSDPAKADGVTAVLGLLNNIATRPLVPGEPASKLIALVAPSNAIDNIADELGGRFSVGVAALYTSLCAPHRGGVSWSRAHLFGADDEPQESREEVTAARQPSLSKVSRQPSASRQPSTAARASLSRQSSGRAVSRQQSTEQPVASRQQSASNLSRKGTATGTLSRQGSGAPASRQQSAAPQEVEDEAAAPDASRQGSALAASRQGSALAASRQGSALAASRQGSALTASRQGSAIRQESAPASRQESVRSRQESAAASGSRRDSAAVSRKSSRSAAQVEEEVEQVEEEEGSNDEDGAWDDDGQDAADEEEQEDS